MQNPYSLSCYILICNQLHIDLIQLLSTAIIMYCKSPDKAVLEPFLIPYLQLTQLMSDMFLFYVFGA